MCAQLTEMLQATERITVVHSCESVEEAEAVCVTCRPDVILLDVHAIVQYNIRDVPTIITSDHPSKNTYKMVQAINHHVGIVDSLKFLVENGSIQKMEMTHVLQKISRATKRKVGHHQKGGLKKHEVELAKVEETSMQPEAVPCNHYVIGIGTSAGGPEALKELLISLPKNLCAPIFIVQHMPSSFTNRLAKRLNDLTKLTVKEAVDGELVRKGTVYIAPGDYHMEVEMNHSQLFIALTKDVKVSGHRPSVDVLFTSMAKLQTHSKIMIVLTGMGKDGAKGMEQVRRLDDNAIMIAEAEATALIYGMPKAAIQTKEVDYILRIEEIGAKIIHYVK